MSGVNAKDIRKLLGDGNFGGYYERPDEEMHAL
jgi:creatinine amidohydrolase